MPSDDHWKLVDQLLDLALAEDVGAGDATTLTLVPENAQMTAHFTAREPGVAAGLTVIERLFGKIDPAVSLKIHIQDSEHMKRGSRIATISGPARAILTGERLALNLLQRMCGVASLTRRYVEEIAGTKGKILDTRKTMPGMRVLDKLAVYLGGGVNHRHGLFDMILIKDNHIHLTWPECPAGSVACAIEKAREHSRLPVECEVDTLDQLREALEAEPDMILLDNMDPDTLAQAVHITNTICSDHKLRRPLLEASGRVNLESVRAVAESGVDRISVGALTHSALALDIGLDIDP